MTSGKMGKVTDSDFDTLFGIIDADGSGQVDFIEFATFMGEIKSNVEAIEVDKGLMRSFIEDKELVHSFVENKTHEGEMKNHNEAFEDDNKVHEG